jgi:GT2 family glycosyltransferase
VAWSELPSFDLVVATSGRTTELERLLASLEEQTHQGFRVVVVDQNEDGRIDAIVEAAQARLQVVHVRSARGLSRARNRGLEELGADLVAFPDDDCEYPVDLLERVAGRLGGDPSLDGLSGRSVGRDGSSSASWAADPALLTDDNLWNRVNSAALFLRRTVVERVGGFDERLGLGSGTPWSSGEEVDYVVRAVRSGARIAYDPQLTVTHDRPVLDAGSLRALRRRDGASVGYLLRKHGYPPRVVGRMLVRPVGGALLSLGRLDGARARTHLETVRGRVAGYRGASSSNSAR